MLQTVWSPLVLVEWLSAESQAGLRRESPALLAANQGRGEWELGELTKFKCLRERGGNGCCGEGRKVEETSLPVQQWETASAIFKSVRLDSVSKQRDSRVCSCPQEPYNPMTQGEG